MGRLGDWKRSAFEICRQTWYWPARGLFSVTRRNGPKRIIVHVGIHKTGTLSVQKTLRENAKLLRLQGVYADWFECRRLAKKLRYNSPLVPADLAEERARLQRLIVSNPEPNIILSKEAFFGDPMLTYRNGSVVASDLKAILDPWPVTIVVCIRRQDTFVESLYGQYIKGGGGSMFPEFCNSIGYKDFHWAHLISCFDSIFGRENTHVRLFDDLPRKTDELVNYMFEGTIPPTKVRALRKKPENLGYSSRAMEIARFANHLLERKERKMLRRFVEKSFPKTQGESLDLFGSSERRALLRHYEPTNEQLFAEYFQCPLPDAWRPSSVLN